MRELTCWVVGARATRSRVQPVATFEPCSGKVSRAIWGRFRALLDCARCLHGSQEPELLDPSLVVQGNDVCIAPVKRAFGESVEEFGRVDDHAGWTQLEALVGQKLQCLSEPLIAHRPRRWLPLQLHRLPLGVI